MYEPSFGPRNGALHSVLHTARHVLLDFDGPVCRLFSHHPAPQIAQGMRAWLTERGTPPAELPGLADADPGDPHALLRAAGEALAGTGVPQQLEERLAEEELTAAGSAEATPHTGELLPALRATGRTLALTTNNSPRAAARYLRRHRLDAYFGPHLYGRHPQSERTAALLKPHPDCLLRALAAFDAKPQDAVMIGDSVADLEAATTAEVPFIGYAPQPHRVAVLRDAGALHVVRTMGTLVAVARTLSPL